MPKILVSPWTMLVFAGIVVGIAVIGRASPLSFKGEILTQVMPSLLAGLFGIAAVMERAVAVLNNIWFGEERERQQDKVRLINKELAAVQVAAENTRQARDTLIREAIRAGSTAALTQVSAEVSGTETRTLEATKTALADLKSADEDLLKVEAKQSRARLYFGFAVALLVSAVGVRTLQSMLDVTALSHEQKGVFHAVDILLTAGLLAGGTSAISAVADLLGTYVSASRKRAAERS
jgi:hypothetical protein